MLARLLILIVMLSGGTLAQESRDLVLLARLASPAQVEPGQNVEVELSVVNRGNSPQLVVKPGDGSESGWREPHVYYTAEVQQADGTWSELERRPIGRCGLYDPNWQDEIVTIKPGQSASLDGWLPSPTRYFTPPREGRLRITAHYVYTQGRAGKAKRSEAVTSGPMKGIPTFHLKSEPFILEIGH